MPNEGTLETGVATKDVADDAPAEALDTADAKADERKKADADAAARSDGPPKSATNFGLSFVALCVVLGTMWLMRHNIIRPWREMDAQATKLWEVMIMAGAVAIPVVGLDLLVLKVHRRASTGLDWDRPFELALGRVATKILGLGVTLAPFALGYWTFPEYAGNFYDPFYYLLKVNWLTLLVGVPLYFAIVDGQMRQPKDAYWQLGRLLLGQTKDLDTKAIANHYRGWLVKGFFFPFMFVWMTQQTHNVIHFDLTSASWTNLRAYDFLYDFIFFIDLIFCTVGYALSLRPIDTHIRTAEPTMLGWTVALFCYPPFYNLMERQYVSYGGNTFGSWLAGHDQLRWAWAIAILALITIYSLATVAFGVRFSNLTHRGILTNGPYRFTKHPAYVTKNISWWLMSVPFLCLDGNWHQTFKRCLCLSIINFMYFMRAKTEERHLSRDPVYVKYALWMNEHGALSFLGRWIPAFRYKPPAEPQTPPAELKAAAQ